MFQQGKIDKQHTYVIAECTTMTVQC